MAADYDSDRLTDLTVWRPSRMHANGMIATVHLRPYGDEVYGYAAMTPSRVDTMGEAHGLEAAKAAADVASVCPQPCSCSPWIEPEPA